MRNTPEGDLSQDPELDAPGFDSQGSPSRSPILEIRDLCKDFFSGGFGGRRIRAVDRVSLRVSPGEILGIVGESGCGKTTLARLCLRLLPPTSGSVLFDGVDLSGLTASQLRAKRPEFQMVFQDPYASLNPSMTVGEILSEPFRVHAIGDPAHRSRRVSELLDAVSLGAAFWEKKPGELSGGQQQRVGIARGLALRPRLLIADEPVSALDVSVQAQILNLLSRLQARYQFTLVLISHSLRVIHYLCSRVLVMFRGRIVEDASADNFFSNPSHPYSRRLLESLPAPDATASRFQSTPGTGPPATGANPDGCAFHPYCAHALRICREKVPPLKRLSDGGKVACFCNSSGYRAPKI